MLKEKTSYELYNELLELIDEMNGNISFNMAGLSAIIDSSDIVGSSIQSWLESWLKKNHYYYHKPENSQKFPDFYLSRLAPNDNMLEIKTFRKKNSPAFDIANYEAYLESLIENPYRLFADYLILSYDMNESGYIKIIDIWLKKIWEITGTSKKYPLKVQEKRGVIYNIRPNSDFKDYKDGYFSNVEELLNALYETQEIYKNKQVADLWKSRFEKNLGKYYYKKLKS